MEGVTLKYIIPSRLNRDEIPGLLKSALEEKGGGEEDDDYGVQRVETVYKPFWYFKGMVYSCRAGGGRNEITGKSWFYTFEAATGFASDFRSLGFRSEVLTLEVYDKDRFAGEALILPVTKGEEEAAKEALEAAEGEVKRPTAASHYHKTSLIGERLFLIYYPVVAVAYDTNGSEGCALFDGINANFLGQQEKGVPESGASGVKEEPYHLTITTHRCNNCGYDLEANDFDIIFYCKNCARLWLLKGNDYHPLKMWLIRGEHRGGKWVYLPFWKLEVAITSRSLGQTIRRIGDLSGLMKMGRHRLRSEDPERPVSFYIPALVAGNANALIKLAARIGTFQKELPLFQGNDLPPQRIWNASLPVEEAEQMVAPLIFLVIGRIDRKAIRFYNDFEVTVTDRTLVWYPFERRGGFLADAFHDYNLPVQSAGINM